MIDWQNIIALGLVGLAAGYLLRKAWRRVAGRTEGACGSCARCATTSVNDSQTNKGVGSLLPERPGECFAQKTPDPFIPPLVQIESQFGQAIRPPDHPHDRTHGPLDDAAR